MKLKAKDKMRAYDVMIGEQLSLKRQEKNLSLQDAADLFGRSKQTIYNYERGIRSLNMADYLVYCDTLKIDGYEILRYVQKKPEKDLEQAYLKYKLAEGK